jgi:NAD(P)-dependent dehydrogenase (short-subunit alcohol dehydrogenase family)
MAKVVVVTGGSAGVGRAVSLELGRQRASVAVLARSPEGLETARSEIEQAGGRALVIPTDVADAEAVERAAERIEEELGPIDVWINNATVTVFAPGDRILPAEYERVTRVAYLGSVYGTLAALRRMKARDRGHIIQIGSALSYRAIPLQAAYCAAKHAIRGFTNSLRCELIHERSKVLLTMVQLPALNTPQFTWSLAKMPNEPQPVPPIFQPEVAARTVVGVIGKRRREVWVGAPTFLAIVGSKLFPGFLDHYLARTAYAAQMTDHALDPERRSNLFAPVDGGHRTHGPFDDRAKPASALEWVSLHRPVVVMVALLITLLLAAVLMGNAAPSEASSRLLPDPIVPFCS